jgi:hypothetical protein
MRPSRPSGAVSSAHHSTPRGSRILHSPIAKRKKGLGGKSDTQLPTRKQKQQQKQPPSTEITETNSMGSGGGDCEGGEGGGGQGGGRAEDSAVLLLQSRLTIHNRWHSYLLNNRIVNMCVLRCPALNSHLLLCDVYYRLYCPVMSCDALCCMLQRNGFLRAAVPAPRVLLHGADPDPPAPRGRGPRC